MDAVLADCNFRRGFKNHFHFVFVTLTFHLILDELMYNIISTIMAFSVAIRF